MYQFTQPTIQSTKASSIRCRFKFDVHFVALLLAYVSLALAPAARALTPDENSAESEAVSKLSLVFADDFSTDPNTNGQWTIHRYVDDPTTEAVWSATKQTWHLTRPFEYLATAVFANYELTATEWRARFRYKVGQLGGVFGGGDGFIFMFYKDKGAYGKPAYGTWMGFELYFATPVPGYGLEFDNYDSGTCDPTPNNYIGLVQDSVCHSLTFLEDSRTGDNIWHLVEFRFKNGLISVAIDQDPPGVIA